MKKINEIIETFREHEKLYEELNKFRTENESSTEEDKEIINKMKEIIVSYYLRVYKFKNYLSNEMQDSLLSNLMQLCDLSKKVKVKNGVNKIYPVKESYEKKKKAYEDIINILVEYQIQNNLSTKEVFEKYANDIGNQLNNFKHRLKRNDMGLYYGSMNYMIERSIFIINCIKHLSISTLNLEPLENTMIQYMQKYVNSKDIDKTMGDYVGDSDDFYDDYDLIESCYKKLLIVENELLPIVVEQWKKYLTNPSDYNDNYRYLMHCFSSGMIEPSKMNKACCSLYTPTIDNLMYGTSGLIYDIDVNSVETMCTDDAGSWTINKEEFIERGCPSRWQLTSLDGETVWYEYPLNSKLITPDIFESECSEKIKNGKFLYSEIYLNKNARVVGVFYTSECQNIDEVRLYAEKNNLPLVKIDAQKVNLIN